MRILAEISVSMGFLVVAYIAMGAAAIVLLTAFFGPGLRYKISATSPEDNSSDDFLGTLEALTDSQVNRRTKLTVYTNGPTFYEQELAAIAGARSSINLEAYIFQKGDIAARFVQALTERARSGVQVNLVIDALGSASTRNSYFSELRKAGGKVAWYHDLKWNFLPSYNNRTHRELMIVDGRIGFIGGAGIADHWWHGKNGQPTWRDTMVKVEGDAVPNLQATFAENWLEGCGDLLTGPDYFPHREDPTVEGCAALVVNSTPSGGGSTRARILFQLLLASAKKSIHLTTPYFLPDKSLIDELVRAMRERNVELKLIVPGKRSDHLLTRSSSRLAYGKLLEGGASIYEYEPAMIHAKILLVDGLWAIVGSTNCDNRSFGLNDEVNLVARNAEFVERLQQDFANDLAASRRITLDEWRRRSIFERVPELVGWVVERQQ
jgi:cardiolipin synthase